MPRCRRFSWRETPMLLPHAMMFQLEAIELKVIIIRTSWPSFRSRSSLTASAVFSILPMSQASTNVSASVGGLLHSATHPSASEIWRGQEKVEPLTQRILGKEQVVETLQELRRLAKGNGPCLYSPMARPFIRADLAKGFIGEKISATLVMFVKDEAQELEER